MFGKGKSKKSNNDRFVLAQGRAAGNIKYTSFAGSKGGKGGSSGKESKGTYKPRTLKVGSNSGFDAE